MKKYRLEIIIFIVNSIYMILELIASRVLSPYFGNSNLVWTSVIGIILLSTSTGNFIRGIIADKKDNLKNVKLIILISALLILLIPIIQSKVLNLIISIINNIKIGAIIATIILFFIPSMFIGMLSPVIIKLKMKDLNNVGKIAGRLSALATLGNITGTFLGGFYLIPNFGSTNILFVLSIIMFLLIFLLDLKEIKEKVKGLFIVAFICIIISGTSFGIFLKTNNINGEKVLNGEVNTIVSYDTQYGRVSIFNFFYNNEFCRNLNIDKGNESATFIDENKCYELVYEYTKYYDLMFKANINVKDTLMIGGAGYSYPKYYISHYLEKNMDVVEIDEKIVDIAKKYFYLDKLINEFDIEKNHRLNLITQDGRVYLNTNNKKYDAILNDAFSGDNPAKTLTTIEAVKKIHNSLNKNGVYLSNIISSNDGNNSRFLKAEVKTLKQIFKNVYVIPCDDKKDKNLIQNNMVVASDDFLDIKDFVEINFDKEKIITDDFCPIENLVPKE